MKTKFKHLKQQLKPTTALKSDLLEQIALQQRQQSVFSGQWRQPLQLLGSALTIVLIVTIAGNYPTLKNYFFPTPEMQTTSFNTVSKVKGADMQAPTAEMVEVTSYNLQQLGEMLDQSIVQPGISYQLLTQEIFVTRLKTNNAIYSITPLVYKLSNGYNDTQLIINLQVGSIPQDDVYYGEATTVTSINNIDITFGVQTFDVNQQKLFIYLAEFMKDGIGYRITGEYMSQAEFFSTIRQMVE